MLQLTCFYNPDGFTFAFKMFFLISNYVYSMFQPPFNHFFYFMFYTYPIFLFIFMSRSDMFLGVESL